MKLSNEYQIYSPIVKVYMEQSFMSGMKLNAIQLKIIYCKQILEKMSWGTEQIHWSIEKEK